MLPRNLQEGEALPSLSVSQVEPLPTVPRVVKFTSGLSAVVAEEGGEATFQCVVTPSDVAVTWFRDGVQLQSGEKFLISQKGASHSLTILSLALEDAGQVTAEAEGIESTAALRVRGELVGRQGGRGSFFYQLLLVSWFPGGCADTPCCRPGSSSLGWLQRPWVCQMQCGATGPGTCSEGAMVNSCSAHLAGEWAEVVIQGGLPGGKDPS